MKSGENFWENLKIHAGGDDKQRIQFAPPYSVACAQPLYTFYIEKVGHDALSPFGVYKPLVRPN